MAQKRLYEKVAEAIADDIFRGKYKVGDRLPSERLLGETHGVSRPTIREAMIALEVDGLVDVCTGSGIYVIATERRGGGAAPADVGPFELLEARALIEAEVAALAAAQVTPEIIVELERLLAAMEEEVARHSTMSEEIDREFHLTIARATNNSALLYMVTELWDLRKRSQQSIRFEEKVRAEGILPRIDEHARVLAALKKKDPAAAREAMRAHLHGVADMVFMATEAEAIEKARAAVAAERGKYRVRSVV